MEQKEINVAKILERLPKGTELWSPVCGYCKLVEVNFKAPFPILVATSKDGFTTSFAESGAFRNLPDTECLLFPSKEQRDWEKFEKEMTEPKEESVTLHPFDKVLLRDTDHDIWYAGLLSHIETSSNFPYRTSGFGCFMMCIPYNDETRKLVGTSNPSPKKYKISFER